MAKIEKLDELQIFAGQKDSPMAAMHRSVFLQYAAVGLASFSLAVASCKKESSLPGINLGSGDIGILNYVYALEQLEAAFYIQVTKSFYAGATDAEQILLNDIRDHEIAHREFFKNALGGVAIPSLDFNFSSIDFSSRSGVLESARALEDLGVSGYNGVGVLIRDEKYLALAGKIVSVEARHAALIRDLITDGSFANSEVIGPNGLEKSLSPAEVLKAAAVYITTVIDAENLPTA